MTVENTSKRDPAIHVLGALADGTDGYITGMEAAGQRQLVNSDRLPTDCRDREAMEALGFTFGEPDPADPMFRPATLPEGWSRKGSDHAMWSYIVDERGLNRVAIFYKAAFYDRSAHMTLVDVGGDLANKAIYDEADDVAAIPWYLLTDEEQTSAEASMSQYLANAERHPDIYGHRVPKVERLMASKPSRGGSMSSSGEGR